MQRDLAELRRLLSEALDAVEAGADVGRLADVLGALLPEAVEVAEAAELEAHGPPARIWRLLDNGPIPGLKVWRP